MSSTEFICRRIGSKGASSNTNCVSASTSYSKLYMTSVPTPSIVEAFIGECLRITVTEVSSDKESRRKFSLQLPHGADYSPSEGTRPIRGIAAHLCSSD